MIHQHFVTWRSRLATAPDTPTCIVIHGGQFKGGVHPPNQFVPEIVGPLPCGVLRGSVVECLTRNPRVLGSSRTGYSEFFVGVSLCQTLQSPNPVLVKSRKDMNNVSCRRDMTEILLKAA